MAADGSALTQLTVPGFDFEPQWSPDGRQIAFTKWLSGERRLAEIHVMTADGSARTRLTNDTTEDADPSWSPDGQRIAFRSHRDGNAEIYVMNADGLAPVRLTNDPAFDGDPSWSPDGGRIAFTSSRDGNSEIYVMGADGSAPTRLTNHPGVDTDPSWSPDGRRIAFTSTRDGNAEVYVMNADGSAPTPLTNHPASDKDPSWSPSGLIAFASNRDGNDEIYVMHADRSAQTRLTNRPAADQAPAWGPWLDQTPPDTIPPPMPGHPVEVTPVGTDASGAIYDVTWFASVDQPSGEPVGLYRLTFGFNDGSWTGADSALSTSARVRLPYHASNEAAPGWVCVRAEDAAGNQSADHACNGLTVPARDTIPPPMPGHPVEVTLEASDATGATYNVSWMPSVDQPSGEAVGLYRLTYGFNDGSWIGADSATGTNAQVRFPYHSSGQTATGWVCVRAEDAAGNQSTDQACKGLTVPAAVTND
jgi:WD40 repeat protein